MSITVPIARSDIHIHLTRFHVELLFGRGSRLTNVRNLTIPGQFACRERLIVAGPSGRIDGVVVVGPERKYTQVEISRTDCLKLGIDAPLRHSGDIEGTPGVKLIGPAAEVDLDKGVITAIRHIHMHSRDAEKAGLKNGDKVKVAVDGERSLIFDNVFIKAGPDEALEMHVDYDEGHAAGIEDFQPVTVLTS